MDDQMTRNNPHCSVNTGGYPGAEIRTKVFRIGAPLLRSTIPVSLGMSRAETPRGACKVPTSGDKVAGDGDSDVETVMTLSDGEQEDPGSLSVTLDFPC
mmetsp:Transcript_137039/g.273323  ORF Transcript_137039/g.273323 Transcript_137039/m.273323 type:complete len:99 (-) Transcript_137039:51-347(-)